MMEINYFILSSLLLPILGFIFGYILANIRSKAMELKIIELSKDLAVKNETIAGNEKENIEVAKVVATLESKAQEVIKSKEELENEVERYNAEKFNRLKNDTTKLEYSGNLRGQQGEAVLKKIINQSTIYIENKNVFYGKEIPGTREKPDVRIQPTEDTMIIADSKAPLFEFDEYFEAMENDDKQRIQELKTAVAEKIIERIKELAKKKYSEAEGAFEHVLLFLPTEQHVQVAREATQLLQKDLDEYAFERKIIITGPRNFSRDLNWAEKLLQMKKTYDSENATLKMMKLFLDSLNEQYTALSDLTYHTNKVSNANKDLNELFTGYDKILKDMQATGFWNEKFNDIEKNSNKINKIKLEKIIEPDDPKIEKNKRELN
tara:strand:- start:255 stop:1385 length:1131 start_codon:yes stop_codon:yes gene_type:complete